jgi:hypothetical protein
MYVLIVSPEIPRLLYWSENCVEVRGQQVQSEGHLEGDTEQGGYSPWKSQEALYENETNEIAVSRSGTVAEDPHVCGTKPGDLANASKLQPACFTMCASKKLLMITTSICACASFAFLCIAVATDYWIDMQELQTMKNLSTNHLKTYTGLWRRCEVTGWCRL